jgi:KipI family sensor histidine kinase inhibitor
MRFLPAGEACLVVELGDTIDPAINERVRRLALALEGAGLPGLLEAVPTYRSVALLLDPLAADPEALRPTVEGLAAELDALALPPPDRVEVPTVYGGEFGPDLEDVARHTGLAPDQVVALHAGTGYRTYMLGFTPGYVYLGGMDPRLATPRLATPRVRVPAGSVGIGGAQTGIYPSATPGGWRIIGRTPIGLFDPARRPPARILPGDEVIFVPIGADRFHELEEQERQEPSGRREERGLACEGSPQLPAPEPVFEVLDPGLFTTVQDLGRHGYQKYGVPTAGAMDPEALRLANLLVGNPEGAAGLEMTARGPALRALADAIVAATGADLAAEADGRPIPRYAAVQVFRGEILRFPHARGGLRGYLALAGGIAVPPVLGSRATYVTVALGGVEGRALRAGDRLACGPPGLDPRVVVGRRAAAEAIPSFAEPIVLRAVLGPQAERFTEAGLATFLSATYRVTDASDRMGIRLTGPAIAHREGADILSDAIPLGAVQVPQDGQPIVLAADRQTTGGYAKIATVIAPDIARLGQAAPGAAVRFREVPVREAREATRGWRAGIRRWASAWEYDVGARLVAFPPSVEYVEPDPP